MISEFDSLAIGLSDSELQQLILRELEKYSFDGKKILVIVPDNTRTIPLQLFFSSFQRALLKRVKKLDFLIALGTHPAMTSEQIHEHFGIAPSQAKALGINIFNHQWDEPIQLKLIGTLTEEQVKKITGGLLAEPIPVTINKKIFEYDELIILGPVFPHEVVGFSGGYKYLFPGISGPEIIHAFHWLSALITNPKTIGHRDTPPRHIINQAAQFLSLPITAFCVVMKGKVPFGLFTGDPVGSWQQAIHLSYQINVVYKPKPFQKVISIAPTMYSELWVGGKCMYKLEPVVDDGGEIIIYAPHLKEVSITHGKYLKEIGYHTRDYFLANWEKCQHVPKGILAHSTHVKGIGTYKDGKEYPRIQVTLATGLPQELCESINLGYLDYRSLDPNDYLEREEEGILVVPNAGEMLYRLQDGTTPDIDRLQRGERSFGIIS
ncbi:MAG: DUF2088 domain-containing protein [Candidatus Atribacteria bacterium]|nr:DUF2088 domain-containing protein [Candidatus Atribacteria bacterium]